MEVRDDDLNTARILGDQMLMPKKLVARDKMERKRSGLKILATRC
jgi:hypothetical protein